MKFVLVLATLLAVGFAAPPHLSDEQKQHIAETHKKCQAIAPLDDATLEKLKNHQRPETIPENWAKHTLCMSKASGTITEDGKVNKEKLKELFEKIPDSTVEKIKAAVDECGKEYENEEETATKLSECVRKHFGHHDH